ncbi:hypothetical protein JIG36_29350 [Actinoplanes sp. LDG1-06]|uniref:Uncharacterized protein n=1 Tax=Paractinoplanes ovalisporus TaxID=2810368 RepID=A0ABS2AK92_9ACTN|nr:hypothetical protein [Actinoplanes ovalisporus]MBM2619656.1 hypothetical protein [Actinoplanes ovalisporus]
MQLTAVPREPSTGGEPLAEFGSPQPAARLTLLLTGLGFTAVAETRVGGVARQYELQRVLVPEAERAQLNRRMTVAWQWGRQQLLDTETRGSLASVHSRRVAVARYAWQAVLLAGAPRRRAGELRVKLGDPETADLLVRGARIIGVTGEVIRRQGCFVVAVANAAVPLLTTAPTTRVPAGAF